MMLLFSDMLYMLVRYVSPRGPCGVVFALFIAAWNCVVVSVILVICSVSVFLSMCMFVLCVLCLPVMVNCLLNAFAIYVGEAKVMLLFWGVLVFCWLVRVLSSKEYVCCVCDPSVCLCVPSICQFCVFV